MIHLHHIIYNSVSMMILLGMANTENKSKQFTVKINGLNLICFIFKSDFNFWIYISTNFEFSFLVFFEFYLFVIFFSTFIFILFFIITKYFLIKSFLVVVFYKLCILINLIRCNTIEEEYFFTSHDIVHHNTVLICIRA